MCDCDRASICAECMTRCKTLPVHTVEDFTWGTEDYIQYDGRPAVRYLQHANKSRDQQRHMALICAVMETRAQVLELRECMLAMSKTLNALIERIEFFPCEGATEFEDAKTRFGKNVEK